MADSVKNPVMAPEIAEAVLAVMAAVGILSKEDKNKFDNYDYASIDSFILHVREHCLAAKLLIIAQEADEPKLVDTKTKDGKPLMMWWSRFGFTLIHETGASYGPIYKTVMVQAKGAQAAGSAQSYALKQLMRGLFLIPTGDKDDPDKTSAEIAASGEQKNELQKAAESIKRKLNTSKTLDALIETWGINEITLEDIREKSEAAYKHLGGVYDKKKEELE